MCKQPIKIQNKSKYIYLGKGFQYYNWVNCGKCEECRQQKQQEWNLRCYYECMRALNNNEWIYFDTLTYDNKHLPRISNFINTRENWSCFNYKDIRDFYEKLRDCYGGTDSGIRYFITSEYGEKRKRNHYHILIFVPKKYEPIEFSKNVSKSWGKGRTDGQPYKSKKYVMQHNVIYTMNMDTIRYVCKYVNKNQSFSETLQKRWNRLQKYYEKSKYTKLQIKAIERQWKKHTDCFHRQSKGFGLYALEILDNVEILKTNRMYYRTNDIKVVQNVTTPMYYKRKLCQTQIQYNGKRIWINTELGTKIKKMQEFEMLRKMYTRIKTTAINKGIKLTKEKTLLIANYILLERGRLKGRTDYRPHHEEAKYYSYNTDNDLKYLGKNGISSKFIGNDEIGYYTTEFEMIDLENKIYVNPEYEIIIEKLFTFKDDRELIKHKERMAELKKIYFQS